MKISNLFGLIGNGNHREKTAGKIVTGDGAEVLDRHATTATFQGPQGLQLHQIAQEKQVDIFEHGEEDGYHPYGTGWWTNAACPHAYQYLSLDALYPQQYFQPGGGHPDRKKSTRLYTYMQDTYQALFGRPFASVLELGTGGGEITSHFLENDLDFLAIEGTTAGVERLRTNGVPPERIAKANLKFLQRLPRSFDIAMCTEVAEHIEPWFASKVVENCIAHSDVVWFSAAKGDARPHYHHMNEVPIAAWDNIFAHMGHDCFLELNGLAGRADRLYLSQAAVKTLETNGRLNRT